MKYVLIVIIAFWGKPATTTAEFDDGASCKTAAETIMNDWKDRAWARCFPASIR